MPIISKMSIKCQKFFLWVIFATPWHFCVLYGDFRQPWAILSPKMPNKANNGKIYKINVCTLETQMSKCRGDLKSQGNPKIWIKTLVRTKLKVIHSGKHCIYWILGYLDTWILGYLDIWIPRYLITTVA